MRAQHNRLKRSEERSALLLSLPALVLLFLFLLLPVFETVWLSLFDYSLLGGRGGWEGLGNYVTAVQDPTLKRALWNTLELFLAKVPLQMVLGLALALIVQGPSRPNSVLRTVIMVPCVTSMVVVTTVWGLMYHPSNGLFNSFLETLGLSPQPFLTSPQQAPLSIAAMLVWKDVGFNMIFFLAGLNGVPRHYYEAARLDGANAWQLLMHITLPMIRRTLVFVLFIDTVFAFNTFTPVYLMTHGGPASATRVIVLYIFELAFRFNRFGLAATASVILGLILLIVNFAQLSLGRERDA
jgi:ABC-type sugar transport system permease subunit